MKRAGAGRKPYAPTKAQRKQVEHWASVGVPQVRIAANLCVGIDTLRKHFMDELDNGRWRAFGKLTGKAFKMAMAGDRLLLMYLMKCMGPEDFKQRANVVHQNPDGTPIAFSLSIGGHENADDERAAA